MDDILSHFPPATQNSSRSILRNLMVIFKNKPSFGLSKKLEAMGVGVTWTQEYGEDTQKPEGFCILESSTEDPVSDEELGELLRII